jgi:predicted ATPase
VAAALDAEMPDGVVFVALAAIRDPHLVPSAIAQALRLHESGGLSPQDLIQEHLRQKQALLVLDNFEQVVEAAPRLAELLSACPHLRVLATSRATLRLHGEQVYVVPPLPLPDPALARDLASVAVSPAVRLFLLRAGAVKPDITLTHDNARAIIAICAHVDGLPLAIELAAARVRVLPPPALLARLEHRLQVLTEGARDAPTRQQTLRNTIAWSYDLLAADEQALFRRLVVCAGGCTMEAAEALCAQEMALDLESQGQRRTPAPLLPTLIVIDGLSALVDNSLLQAQEEPGGEVRFVFLETIREFGLECLEASGEMPAVRQRHAGYLLALTEAAEPDLIGPGQAECLTRLEREHDNLRSVLRWASDTGQSAIGLRIAGVLWRFWLARGHTEEGSKWLEELLALDGRDVDHATAPIRAKALDAAGVLAIEQGDYESAVELAEEALALHRTSGESQGMATALNILGSVAQYRGDYSSATALYGDSLAVSRDAGNDRGISIALANLGQVAREQEDYERAAAFYEESLALSRKLGSRADIAISLEDLAFAARGLGDYGRAVALQEESLIMKQDVGDHWGVALSLGNLGHLSFLEGNYERAVQLYAEGLSLCKEMGNKLSSIQGLEGLAYVIGAQGQPERATRLLAAAAGQRATAGIPLPPSDREIYDQTMADLQTTLGNRFGPLWNAGLAMSLEEAVAYALMP